MVTLKSFLGMIAAVPFIMACNQTGQVNATLFLLPVRKMSIRTLIWFLLFPKLLSLEIPV